MRINTGRPPYVKQGKTKKPRKPMKARKRHVPQEERDWMADVASLPCAVCGASGPSEVHHVYHDRFGQKKASNWDVISLCAGHHRIGKEAIHNGKETWRSKHGPDWSYIPWVREQVEKMRKERL